MKVFDTLEFYFLFGCFASIGVLVPWLLSLSLQFFEWLMKFKNREDAHQ